jgi:hypothetical protein
MSIMQEHLDEFKRIVISNAESRTGPAKKSEKPAAAKPAAAKPAAKKK